MRYYDMQYYVVWFYNQNNTIQISSTLVENFKELFSKGDLNDLAEHIKFEYNLQHVPVILNIIKLPL